MTNELKELVENQIEAKKKQELERIEKQLNADREVIDKAIELIKTHTLYKKVSKNNHYIYQLVTEEDLKNDYIKEPKNSWNKGIQFQIDSFNERVNKGVIEVNGERYYDIRYALNTYEQKVSKLTDSLDWFKKKIEEKQKELALLNENFPTLKKAIEEWQKYEREGE
jgi:chromosome segregation ATPase